MENIKVSVILPVFNGDKYLAEAIESVLGQTHKNFELIIFDDGSTDGSLDLARSYQEKDVRVFVHTRKNKGLVATLNEAILLSRSDYIVRMDADDICYPDRIERQLQWMIDGDFDLVGGSVDVLEGSSIIRTKVYREESDEIKASILIWGRNFCHPAVLARKSLYEKHPYEDFPGIEDFVLWIRLALDKKIKVGNLAASVLKYRMHEEQVTQSGKDKQWHSSNQLKVMQIVIRESNADISEQDVKAFESLVRPKKRYMSLRDRTLAIGLMDKLFQSNKLSQNTMKVLLVIVYLRLKRKSRPKNKRWLLNQLMVRIKFMGGENLVKDEYFERKNSG